MIVVRMNKRLAGTIFRVLVSFSAIALLLTISDREQIIATFARLDPLVLVVPFLLLQGQTLLSALKWWMILKKEGESVPYWFLARTYFIGNFFSLFLPSSIGGDVYRTVVLKGRINSLHKSATSIFFDRLSGLFALISLALIGAFMAFEGRALLIIVGVYLFGLLAYAVMLWLSARLPGRQNRIMGFIHKVTDSLRAYSTDPAFLLKVLALSFVFQSMIIVINWLYCQALVIKVPVDELFVIVPLAYITDMIPVSVNGIGVRDSAFAALFVLFGHLKEEAIGLSLLILGMRYVSALTVGGTLFLFSRRSAAE